tara:strand:- start:13838 stop:14551 length:714 start_codon:yes stop_codon:yes gene_type:complete
MADTLYSSYIASGITSGRLAESLSKTSQFTDEISFIEKETAFKEKDLESRMGEITSALELGQTVMDTVSAEADFRKEDIPKVESKYGDIQKDERKLWQKTWDVLRGKEPEYKFHKDIGGGKVEETVLTKSRAKIEAGMTTGEEYTIEPKSEIKEKITMAEEINLNNEQSKPKSFIKKILSKSDEPETPTQPPVKKDELDIDDMWSNVDWTEPDYEYNKQEQNTTSYVSPYEHGSKKG